MLDLHVSIWVFKAAADHKVWKICWWSYRKKADTSPGTRTWLAQRGWEAASRVGMQTFATFTQAPVALGWNSDTTVSFPGQGWLYGLLLHLWQNKDVTSLCQLLLHITVSPLTLYNHNMPWHAIASSQPLPASRQKADILGTSNNCNQVLEDLHTWRWIEYSQPLNIKNQSEWYRSRSSRNVKRSFFRDLLDIVVQSINSDQLWCFSGALSAGKSSLLKLGNWEQRRKLISFNS